MKVAINALPARVGGGVTFFRNVLPLLPGVNGKHEFLVILARDQTSILDILPPQVQPIVLGRFPHNYWLRFFWEQLILPVILWRRGIDVLYTHGNVTSLAAPCRKVLVVTGANAYSPLQFDYTHAYRFKHAVIRAFSVLSARAADRVIFISDDSRRRIAPRIRVRADRSEVSYFGFEAIESSAAQSASQPAPYLLTVSVLWPHKNIERLMLAFDRLRSRHSFDGRLLIAGPAHDSRYFKSLEALRRSLPVADQIVFTGSQSSNELAGLYRGATAFVFPSLEETLGIPLLEAMGYGVPVVAADCGKSSQGTACFSPFPELAGDAAVYFDPFDVESITAALEHVTRDATLRNELSERGRARAREFTWDRTARELVATLAQAANGVTISPVTGSANK